MRGEINSDLRKYLTSLAGRVRSIAPKMAWTAIYIDAAELKKRLRRYGCKRGEAFVTSDVRRGIVDLLPRLRRFAYALAGDPEKGDDLVQEGCARAFARLDQWQPGTRLDSWMFKIIRNIWLDQKRAAKVRGVALNLDAVPEPKGLDGRDTVEHRLTLKRVLDAMAKLPQQHRELIALICIEGVSYQEAAAILGVPMGTVTSRLVRARQALYAIAVEGQNAEGQSDESVR
jgi:RNA polymerase sigma-70 factor (ECF subfamily)